MRKIVVYELLSRDGVAEAPDTFFGWDDAVDAKLAAEIPIQDAVILGRRTYTEWARSGRAARSSLSRHSSTGSRSTSRHRRPLTGIGPIRR